MDDLYRRVVVSPHRDSSTLHYYHKSKISLNDAVLDGLLQGGFTTKEISELVGEASSGKTQLCLQLLVHAVYPSCDGPSVGYKYPKAVYFYTEGGDAPLDRLKQIAWERCGKVPGQCREILENIYTEHSFVSEEDLICRLIRLEELLSSSEKMGRSVKVLVVDSIAFLFRDLDINNMWNALSARSASFFKIAGLLKRYADEYDIAVVVTNHVVDLLPGAGSSTDVSNNGYLESFPGCAGLELISNCKAIYPALGISWSSCVNARFFVSKEAEYKDHVPCPVMYKGGPLDVAQNPGGTQHLSQVRGIQVVFSPDLPQAKAQFLIRWNGCCGISYDASSVG